MGAGLDQLFVLRNSSLGRFKKCALHHGAHDGIPGTVCWRNLGNCLDRGNDHDLQAIIQLLDRLAVQFAIRRSQLLRKIVDFRAILDVNLVERVESVL